MEDLFGPIDSYRINYSVIESGDTVHCAPKPKRQHACLSKCFAATKSGRLEAPSRFMNSKHEKALFALKLLDCVQALCKPVGSPPGKQEGGPESSIRRLGASTMKILSTTVDRVEYDCFRSSSPSAMRHRRQPSIDGGREFLRGQISLSPH